MVPLDLVDVDLLLVAAAIPILVELDVVVDTLVTVSAVPNVSANHLKHPGVETYGSVSLIFELYLRCP